MNAPADLVSDADYQQLSRLVVEHAWRTDNGRSDTLHVATYTRGDTVDIP